MTTVTTIPETSELDGRLRSDSTDKSTIRASEDNVGTKLSGDTAGLEPKGEMSPEQGSISAEPSPMTFPDGGLRAWLVAFGVCLLPL